MQKGIRLNDGHVTYLGLLAKKDGTRRGCLSKKSSDNTKWHTKWFALLQNMLFYFESESSSRPSGLYLLEGCVCDRSPSPKPSLSAKECLEKQYYFTVSFSHENQKALELRTEDVKDCDEWVAAISHASYRNLATEHETLMQKYLHLLQIVETEKTVAKQLRQQIEDGEIEIERLKSEIAAMLKDNEKIQSNPTTAPSDDDSEIKKIKKILQGVLIMHDEVSETENIRKNLAIERMIVEGCEILLDTSQTFVRQGSLIQVPMSEKGKITRGRLGSLSLKKEGERQCFLFSKHLIICTRGSGGKLHLTKNGVVSLIDCTLIEEPEGTDDESKSDKSGQDMEHLDFKIVVEPKDSQSFTIILVASSRQEKSAWTSDISQCIDNIRCNGLMMNAFEENSKVTVPQMIKSDASLYCDDVDIRFSKMMNSCKVLQIRYASVERLLERLTDLRFLSIDFLNTFLHSYRVFTSADVVLDKLITIYKKPISAIPARSLELFFASSQNNKLLYGEPPKSPRASRKFSSPPPLAITKTSSPNRRRKLSLNIPIITGGKALDLAALSCSSNGYASMYSSMSPFSKTTLDINKLYVSSPITSKIPDEGEGKTDKADEVSLCKQDISVREEIDNDQIQSDEAEAEVSPTKSPTTPKNVKCKNSSEFSLFSYNNGMVMSSCRELDNNRSALSAASAFAIATAGANEGTPTKEKYRRMSLASTGFPTDQRNGDKEFVIRRAATNRVLNVLRHWVSKHSQDFETNTELKMKVISFLEEVMHDPELLTQERKAAANIIRTLTQEDPGDNQISLEEVLQMAEGGTSEPFENHSALEIAEQLTLLDHLVFKVIPYEEFFGQGWMKNDKNEKTPYIMKTTKHFNDISNLIATEILCSEDVNVRVAVIEKWVAVADICRCLHNYNAVLEITSSLNRSSIFRLKKTWLKVSKQTKTVIDKLQKLVSSEGRFKNLREALKNCDPPCVPYLGMYLTDLAFIEEGTPNYTEDNLVNFSKMRMISHIIREIRQFQQTAYKIDYQPKAALYLLDRSSVMDEEGLYEASLRIEPKVPN
ncbi:ras-specific guanine nucleotide-releasing factor 1 [Sinocyclocheilus grahami]|uniref:ras-specific guanine nucleotide-releasing factor 1 n=1 Tax=Sinocyclocheilus grahami TaxID=75366 RepID=UPI0007ACB73B|nr:PREDICTED: ras-specific guanine nucleotide-releasing factor 1 [Sinocyclocheilus grahami]